MHRFVVFVAVVIAAPKIGTSPEPPLTDTRISVHTLVREDVFAGVLEGDLTRLARGEKSIATLLERRPAEKPALLVWQAGATLYRAVRALEDNRRDEFDEKYRHAMDLVAQAKKLGPDDLGVTAASAGFFALMADRLPEQFRPGAWSAAYDNYQVLWKKQSAHIERLPLHMRGELLGGLAESAQRTGRAQELGEYLDKILAVAPNTPYAKVAAQWKDDPKAAAVTRMSCLTCHSPGRLSARIAALEKE